MRLYIYPKKARRGPFLEYMCALMWLVFPESSKDCFIFIHVWPKGLSYKTTLALVFHDELVQFTWLAGNYLFMLFPQFF